jgi:hypothetical protein
VTSGDRLRSASSARDVAQRLQQPRARRVAYAVLAVVLAVLVFFPRQYDSRVKMLPQDENAYGLTAALGMLGGGLQNFASLIASHQTIDVYVIIGQSHDVAVAVIKRLDLQHRWGLSSLDDAEVKLSHRVAIEALNGGVLEVDAKDYDREFSRELAGTYAQAIQDRATALSREGTEKKKLIVAQRFRDAVTRVAETQAALDQFRRENKLAEPGAQLGAAVTRQAELQGQLQANTVALQAAEQFATPENLQVKAIQANIAALQTQLAQANATTAPANSPTNLATKSIEYQNLYRDENFAVALYDIYSRSLEQVTVEDLTANANTNVQIIEAAHVDPHWQLNLYGAGALCALLLIAFYTEYYAPATRLGRTGRPRAGS